LLIFALKDPTSQLYGPEANREIPHIVIDPTGDVVLEFYDSNDAQQGSCVVSTKVLSLTSPSFARMFKPGFEEGDIALAGGHPTIKIRGDEFLPMENILRILHYQGDATVNISAEILSHYAIHCDKYDFAKALGPWITHWFEKVQNGTEKSKQLGHVILAAYMFRDEVQFTNVSQKAMLRLLPTFASEWDLTDELELLPSKISGEPFRPKRKAELMNN
jgi:hypothetical protein